MSITKAKNISLFVLISAGTLFVMMLLHEAGHAIAAVSCGADIAEISFDHTTWGEAPFTASQLAWVYLNGTLFPGLVSVPFFFFPRRGNRLGAAVAFGAIAGGWIELYSWTVMAFILSAESDPVWFLTFTGAAAGTVRIISVAVCLMYTAAVCWRGAMIIIGYFDLQKKDNRG